MMENEYLVILYDTSGLELSEPLVYSAIGDTYQSVEKDVRSRLDDDEFETYDFLIMLKQDLIPLIELPIIDKEKK